ncbi:OadG family protein [Aliarcobacter trophiarum]|uniref:OAD_gamma domain-containing protein n=2 Tax=Aliarcobacter trophiarum LMG 25534 TaxID=1032241 RepID=A0AAD0QHZ9_9BACT|nr:OadG family protein [Aliarcobacter trophiarum]AXK48115.1 OAD_gamma domain-containing protein [Aliarcobacter trophiarum LMG 25534]
MEALIQAIFSFLIIMGIVSTILLVIGFLLKAKGVTFVEFFPKKPEPLQPQQVIYNNVISQAPTNPYGIDARKVAAIMAAIEHHTKAKA